MHSDILSAAEAAQLIQSRLAACGIEKSSWDVLGDAQYGRRGLRALPVAKKGGRRYFRRSDVEHTASEYVAARKSTPKRRPAAADLKFGITRPDPASFIDLT